MYSWVNCYASLLVVSDLDATTFEPGVRRMPPGNINN
jgi:hypothetical protein